MGSALTRHLSPFLAGFAPIVFLLNALPSSAASALAAWALGSDGVLHLRTSSNSSLKAFFQAPDDLVGARVWVDFPGELLTPRKFLGSGPVREIRLGKPNIGFTRLVVEFNKSVDLDPSRLKLIGVSSDRWKLDFVGLPVNGLKRIGEGSLLYSPSRSAFRSNNFIRGSNYLNSSDLTDVYKGRYKVVIDPGHGGPDPGALGLGGVRESDVVLDVSLKVASLLRSKGVIVKLTRKSEIDLDLPPRVAIANRLGANAFVSIHANASRSRRGDVNGIETFYFSGSRGLRLSSHIQNQVLQVSPGSPDRGVRRGRFFVIRRTNMPAALVEIGFLTGSIDSPRLANSSHRRKLAFAIAEGILLYLKGVR